MMRIKMIAKRQASEAIPEWAILQRRLIDVMNAAVDYSMEKYVLPGGYLMWPPGDELVSIDGLDDAYESFHSFPLFYLAGGADKFLELAQREYDAITEQFSRYDSGHGHPMVVNEYEQGYDWMHQGEGYLLFYLLNLANPGNEKNIARSIRYANFYSGLDPDVPNYNAEANVYRCCYMGSMGPAYRNFDNAPWEWADWKKWYGLPYHDVPGVQNVDDIKIPEKAKAMGDAMTQRLTHSDTLVNIFATTMVMNAYLHTGDDRYKRMILRYLGGWAARAEANGGIVPDNAGQSGIVGENMGGKWYGGYYGWTWPHGFYFIADALCVAAENTRLLSGGEHMELFRSQLRILKSVGREIEGTLYIPQKKGDPGAVHEYYVSTFLEGPDGKRLDSGEREGRFIGDPHKVSQNAEYNRLYEREGWFEFSVMPTPQLAHLWMESMADEDARLIAELRDNRSRPDKHIQPGYSKYQGGQDMAWLSYLAGGFGDYPEAIMKHNLSQVYGRLKMMREDTQDPATYGDAYLQLRNPITVEGLVHLTMGGPMPIYNGGLLNVSVIHYDIERERPGLPEDVAVNIHTVKKDALGMTIVNQSPLHTRKLLMQAGAFCEHEFVSADYANDSGAPETIPVNGQYFAVEVGPGVVFDLALRIKRNCHTGRYAAPFGDEEMAFEGDCDGDKA